MNNDQDNDMRAGFTGGLISALIVTLKRGELEHAVVLAVFGAVTSFAASMCCRSVERWFRKL
jgi:hypothetical protein